MSSADIDVSPVLLDDDDRKAFADMLRELVHAEIAPRTARPEDPVKPETVDDILARLTELGVLTGDADPGLGVWDRPDDPASCRFSLHTLGQIAEGSPAVAYALHLRALAGWLDRAANKTDKDSLISFDRLGAAAGRAVGRAIAGKSLSDNDTAALRNDWGSSSPESPWLLIGTDTWQHTWCPRWGESDGWQLVRIPRESLSCTPLLNAHGLDELTYHSCHGETGGYETVLHETHIIDAFALHGMGLLSIAAATVRRAVTRARDYSRTRRQGGELIAEHDAIAQLLSRSHQSLATADAVLDHLGGLQAGLERLHQVWRTGARLHLLLSAAGSDALQVFGGIGYMRDVGAEKDLRDLNTLRLLGGSPSELTLRCAALDDAAEVMS